MAGKPKTPCNLVQAIELDGGNNKKMARLDGEFHDLVQHILAGNPASKLTITIEASNAGRERYSGAQQVEYSIDSKLELKKRKPNPTVLFATDGGTLTDYNPKNDHLPGMGTRARSAEQIETESDNE